MQYLLPKYSRFAQVSKTDFKKMPDGIKVVKLFKQNQMKMKRPGLHG